MKKYSKGTLRQKGEEKHKNCAHKGYTYHIAYEIMLL